MTDEIDLKTQETAKRLFGGGVKMDPPTGHGRRSTGIWPTIFPDSSREISTPAPS